MSRRRRRHRRWCDRSTTTRTTSCASSPSTPCSATAQVPIRSPSSSSAGSFPKSVRMHVLEDGVAREILYSPDYFTVAEDSPARQLPPDANGFAGFWIQESRFAERAAQAGDLGQLPGRLLLPCRQRGGPVGHVGPRRGARRGRRPARGVPGLRRPLDLLGRQRERPGRGPFAARRAQPRRCLPVRDRADHAAR